MSGLKQRIIGALVLISLAVIFVPMMFDEPHDERSVRSLDIPEEPPFPEVSVPEDEGAPNEVPDYRVEEVDPAPTPEPVEDPAMGTQPDVSTEVTPSDGEEAPLVGEQEEPAEPADDESTASSGSDGSAEDASADSADEGSSSSGSGSDADADDTGASDADYERTLEGAWVLQLGSFGNEDNARRLRDKVREQGYGAHLQKVTRGEQRLVRVFSGPFAEEEEAEKAKKVLDEAFGVQALVTRGEG